MTINMIRNTVLRTQLLLMKAEANICLCIDGDPSSNLYHRDQSVSEFIATEYFSLEHIKMWKSCLTIQFNQSGE